MRLPALLLFLALPAMVQAQEPATTYNLTGPVFGCRYLPDTEYFYKLLLQRDAKAIEAFKRQKSETFPAEPECMLIPKGAKVTVMERTILNSQPYECTRTEGEPNCLWTPAFSVLMKS